MMLFNSPLGVSDVLLEKDVMPFTDKTKYHFEIDEIPENGKLIQDIIATLKQEDVNGNPKYYVLNGELHSRDGWVNNG